ncbi:TIGR02679 family protein [Arthrobacter sp. FW306-2-2C-D06B]|uniref:TIGR02679 family protein n=1 Tax=Arthrobacter sp. FW306-2-2C-D06B TaxID=2879618 RepID=UPI001F16B820|nr:TIGR02679 family protein [Arthrobacter sp. FW306-2-2C-D06B]UKA60549.1 TIGR02679 family protein [Arthrobacter sp. FW306-2-2C-D06B]
MTAQQPAGDRAALDRLLGVPEMGWLLDRVRGRILGSGGEPLKGVVQLNESTAEQRLAAVKLVGRPKRAGMALRVDLNVVEEILRRGPWPAGLADAVETLTGPVVDRRAEREREAAAWDVARDGLAPAAARFPRLPDWWDGWCSAGGLKRAARAEAARTGTKPSPAVGAALVSTLLAVLELLPAHGDPLAILARRAVGDAHALDASRPLGRLSVSVIRAAFLPDEAVSDGESSPRDVWAAAGVVLSNLASTVLCLGVPGVSPDSEIVSHPSQTATASSLEGMRAARMPVLLTLDQVRSGGVQALPHGSVIHICENPTVVEVVADRWARITAVAGTSGAGGPVLVCTSGQPSTAVVELLRRLTGEGAECRYHGDFDWAGLRIARSLSAHVKWMPWRYKATDYRAALRDGKPSLRLAGSPAGSPWDPNLAVAMAECGLALEEEAVANLLAGDVLAARLS